VRRDQEDQWFDILYLSRIFFIELVDSLSQKDHFDNVTLFLLISSPKYLDVQLLHDHSDLHHNKLEHWVRVNVFILCEENSDPGQSFSDSHKVVCVSLIAVQSRYHVFDASLASDKLKNREETFF